MGENSGRRGRVWNRLKREVYARRAPCCRCHQPINYALPYRDPLTGRVNRDSKSVDHFPHPLSTDLGRQLAEDLSNLAAAHLRCNWSAGATAESADLDLGQPSEDW